MLVMQRSHHEWTRRILTRVSRLSEKFTGPVNTSPFYSSSCNKHSFQIGGTMSSPTTSPTLAQLVCGLDTKTHKPRPFTASAQSASTPHNQPVNLESSETLLAHERSFFCFEHPEARRHHEGGRCETLGFQARAPQSWNDGVAKESSSSVSSRPACANHVSLLSVTFNLSNDLDQRLCLHMHNASPCVNAGPATHTVHLT